LDKVKASYQTPYGLVESSYTKTNSRFNWHITVPPNSSAVVYIPANNIGAVTEGGKPASAVKEIKLLKMEKGKVVLSIGSGSYDFEVKS